MTGLRVGLPWAEAAVLASLCWARQPAFGAGGLRLVRERSAMLLPRAST